MTVPRLHLFWDGDAFRPVSKLWAGVCDEHLVVDERYWMREDRERSSKSHRHYFAVIAEAWAQLPEPIATMFPPPDGPELLRKYALIKTGYCSTVQQVFGTNEDALRAAAMIEDRSSVDRYTLCAVNGCVVTKWTAETQRQKAMGADRFQRSKQDVLELLAHMVGCSVEELVANTEMAA